MCDDQQTAEVLATLYSGQRPADIGWYHFLDCFRWDIELSGLAMIGLDPCLYGTHSLRRTKATLIYKKTGIFSRAVQLVLGHTKIESRAVI